MRTKRLLVLLGSVCLALVLAVPLMVACAAPTPTPTPTEAITLKVSEVYGPGKSYCLHTEKLAELVEQRSGGRLKLKIYYSQSLAKSKDNLTAVKLGTCDLARISPGFHAGELPVSTFIVSPYDLVPVERRVELWEKGMPYIDKELEAKGQNQFVLSGTMCSTCPIFFKEPCKTVEDWKGKKVRVFGTIYPKVVEALGGMPWQASAAEASEALERGMIDATTMSITTALAWQFFEEGLAPYVTLYYYPNSVGIQLININRDCFDSLPDDLQNILLECGEEAYKWWASRVLEIEDGEWAEFSENGGHVYILPESEEERWDEILSPIWAKSAEAAGPDAVEFLQIALGMASD